MSSLLEQSVGEETERTDDGEEDEEKKLRCPECGQMSGEAKFLVCLHSLCLECLSRRSREEGSFVCPVCGEESGSISSPRSLPDDWLKIQEVEEWNWKNDRLQCQSCVSAARSVAHCSTCRSYLCSKCSQAHQAMKCFEQHRVRELQQRSNEDEGEKEELVLFSVFDEERSNALSESNEALTSLHEHCERTKRKIEETVEELHRRVKEVGEEHLRLLLVDQREEEMRLLDRLNQLQKNSQALDELRLLSERYRRTKGAEKEQRHSQEELFKKRFTHFSTLFNSERRPTSNEHFLHFTPPSSFDRFDELLREQLGTLSKGQGKTTNGPSLISSSSSSGIDTALPPTTTEEEEEEEEPVGENLRALETIFGGELSHPNVQRNLEEIFQMTSLLTRQSSAPPLLGVGLGHGLGVGGSPPSSSSTSTSHYPPPSLLTTTYSSTNSGGSSNGNNSRSTTPFSGSGALPVCPFEVVPRRGGGGTGGQSMQVRAKFGSLGPQKCQFNAPHGFCLGIDEEIIVADTNNHRIQIFEKIGEYKYQFGIPGKEEGQLWYPRKVAVIRQSGKFVVCDRGNERSRMQIFTRNGHFLKKISIRYIDIVAGLAITQQGLSLSFSLSLMAKNASF